MATVGETYVPGAVVAIDFGTTYTGYAYSFRSEFQKSNEAREIFHNSWNSSLAGNLSKKAPTVALFEEDGTFHSFGYDAEEKYTELAEAKTHHEWHYYARFKMQLFDKMTLTRNFEIEDQEGRTCQAQTVFSESIRFLKKAALDEINERNPIAEEDIHWVLTVPAIWNEPAKQFMRDAAVKAGIPANQLMLALEPKAAAIYCRTLKQGTFSGISKEDVIGFLSAGGRYMILDMGGGTVDIAVHEVSDDGTLTEIIPSSGGDWGGTNVDGAFYDFIDAKIGKEDAKKLKKTKQSHWMKLQNNFEVKKRKLNKSTENDIRVDIPPVLIVEGNLDIKLWNSYKMDIPNKEFKAFFASTVKILGHVKTILSQVEGVNLILMVGGYSQSGFVSNQIKEAFPDQTVLIPPQAEVAVMDGAVMFGFEPWTVSARMCRHTYGIRIMKPFAQGKHDPEHRRDVNLQDVCINIFQKIVSKGEIVKINDKRVENTLISGHWKENRKHLEMTIPIFASTADNPKYTTDPSCQQIGIITIMPPTAGWPSSVKYCLEVYFGRTEFDVRVFNDAKREEYQSKFDLLEEKEIPHVPQPTTRAGVKTTSRCVIS
ncbi:heat shock 70 kDa protein 12B-like [Pecten maximus]|uniref:heat shock 70 kDa protein 12B-like n=1 Tax=Pecten maximus TaxID=6579 RepID=UPI0014586B68|nr:heat shock 70 kDa protein 12B-like [Pecten maximus]